MDMAQVKLDFEGGENMRDISELHQLDLGEIIWQHKSGASDEYIAKRLRVKKWQIKKHIDDVKRRFGS